MASFDLIQKEKALETFLVERPRKYKYRPDSMYHEDVLFLLPNISEIGHLETIGFVKLTGPYHSLNKYI